MTSTEGGGTNSMAAAALFPSTDYLHLEPNFTRIELLMPLKGFRQFVAITYLACNLLGFLANSWVFFVVAPLLWLAQVRVPKSILCHILALCVSDLATMFGMVLLNLEILNGTWRFGLLACRAYLLFDSLNKFSAPVIVLLISRTCYSIICLDKGRQRQQAAGLRLAFLQVLLALAIVLCLLWPLLVYSEVSEIVVRRDLANRQELFVRKCAFLPPPSVELLFNIVVSITSYCIPFAGFLFWYASVPYFLWRRKELLSQNPSNTFSSHHSHPNGPIVGPKMANNNNNNGHNHHHQPSPSMAVIKRVVVTVVVLAAVYLICWTPYWVGMYAQRLFQLKMNKQTVIAMYYVHLMPYVSCAAYPAIFTLFNRPIRQAHSQWRRSMQRKMEGNPVYSRLRDILGRQESQKGFQTGRKRPSQGTTSGGSGDQAEFILRPQKQLGRPQQRFGAEIEEERRTISTALGGDDAQLPSQQQHFVNKFHARSGTR